LGRAETDLDAVEEAGADPDESILAAIAHVARFQEVDSLDAADNRWPPQDNLQELKKLKTQ
jgi:hypothetical protein